MINVVKISDGLGNQLFQYAFARRLQMMMGKNVYLDIRFINNENRIAKGETSIFLENNDYREYGLKHFRITLPIATEEILSKWDNDHHTNTIWKYREEKAFKINYFLERWHWIFPTYFEGYFFDLKYYKDIRSTLQREIRLKESLSLPRKLANVLHCKNTVGMHIRRGDFTKLHLSISEDKYYSWAMKAIERKIEKPVYLIFSDDIKWVKENISINAEKMYISEMGFTDYEEFAIMKHCKNHIIANSTFSYWAAYLNSYTNKIVIYPENWSKMAIIPNDWIGIPTSVRGRI